jgi:hypothetical protein
VTTVAIHQPQYLPWLPLVDKADSCDVFVYLDTVQYQKRGLQNRNQILAANGPTWLTVPVHARRGDAIRGVTIAEPAFGKKHAATIAHSYARAAHLDRFAPLQALLEREWTHLAELSIAVSEWLFGELGVRSRRVRASELAGIGGHKSELMRSICRSLGACSYLSGQGARVYQDEADFAADGLELRYHDYHAVEYRQCRNQPFVPGLSALDLVLNLGPASRERMLAGRASHAGAAQERA